MNQMGGDSVVDQLRFIDRDFKRKNKLTGGAYPLKRKNEPIAGAADDNLGFGDPTGLQAESGSQSRALDHMSESPAVGFLCRLAHNVR